jgi:hypothetical protein
MKPLAKRQNEQIFSTLLQQVISCHRNTATMQTLYKPDNSPENRFHNACLSAMIQDRQNELNYKGGNGECYI